MNMLQVIRKKLKKKLKKGKKELLDFSLIML